MHKYYITRTFALFAVLWLSLTAFGAESRDDDSRSAIVYINGGKYYLHTVAAGDTLYSISRRYGVDTDAIVKNNPAAADVLRPDMTLKIPVPDTSKQPEPKKKRRDYEICDVRAGETLYSISRRYGISIETVMEDNPDVDPSHLSVGTRLYLRKSALGTLRSTEVHQEWENYLDNMNSVAPDGYFYYMVQAGDTLYSLGRRYGISEDEILRLNDLPDGLKAGGLLKLPLPEGGKAENGPARENDAEEVNGNPADSAGFSADGRFREVTPDRALRVALLLPMTKNGGAVNGHYLDFYRGFLLGAEDIKNAGYSMDITLFDTEQSAGRTAEIVESGFGGSQPDLIVGPVYENELAAVTEYAERYGVPVVSPLASLSSTNSRVVFQMSPDGSRKYDKTADLFDGSREVTLVYGSSTDKDFEREVLGLLNGRSYNTHKYVYQHHSAGSADFTELMRGDRDRVIVVLSDNETEVDRILAAIASADIALRTRERNMCRFVVFGSSKWQRYANLDHSIFFNDKVVLLSSYSARRDDEKVRTFDDRHITDYGTLPSLYTYRGYDAARIFGEGMFGGIERSMTGKRYRPLQTSYTFEMSGEGGRLVNTEWMRIDYRDDYTVNVE